MSLKLHCSAILVIACLIYQSKGLLQDVSCNKALSNSINCMFTNLNDDEISFKDPTESFESVIFKNCNLTKFPTTLFSTFTKLTKVDLSLTQVRQLNGNKTLNGAKNLKILDLSRNSLKGIEDFVFSEGKELVELHLSRNKIISVGLNAFAGLNKLELLDLSFNDIKILTEEVFSGLKNLKFIYVNNNDLKNLTFDLRDFKDLTEFDISHNKHISMKGWLTDLPSHIKPKLTVNYSYCNEDETSFNTWGPNIKTYILKHNKVIDMITVNNVRWETLDISENLLRDITNITKIQTLQNLDLSENPLAPLNISTFSLLDDLRTLNLRSTGISLDQDYFTAQKKLTFLDISGNGLTSLDLRNLKSLSSLQTLYLHENNLTELEDIEDIKMILPNLIIISLFKNNFSCAYNILMHELFENLKIEIYDGTKINETDNITNVRVNCSEMNQLRRNSLEQAIFFKQITNYLENSFQKQLEKISIYQLNLEMKIEYRLQIMDLQFTKLIGDLKYIIQIERLTTNNIVSKTITDLFELWEHQNKMEKDLKTQTSCNDDKYQELVKEVKDLTDQVSYLKNSSHYENKIVDLMSEIKSIRKINEEGILELMNKLSNQLFKVKDSSKMNFFLKCCKRPVRQGSKPLELNQLINEWESVIIT
ncbi:leucine-rich repeat-containing protein 40-like [Lutzomyia longipalpis]|uniref:leucine-rich repeat-containing protein 40-like n=1 Tax=Lutzomyia longipalpis TaxID=7200 RepID=UPI002483616D|nr:leucine-rich repeat-containing protein 40-like [Lutzomyia longipalpis]